MKAALTNLEARPAPAGEMNVVLGPGWPGILLHEAIGHGLEGDFNRKGTSAFAGLMGLFLAPFITPMTIDADPSRLAAMQTGAAQLLGGSMGPLLASRVVGDHDVRGVLWLGAGLLLAGLSGIAWLRFTHRSAPDAEAAGA